MNSLLIGRGSVGRLVASVGVLLALTGANVNAMASDEGFKVSNVEGKAEVIRDGSDVLRPLEEGMSIFPGDTLIVAPGANVVVNTTTSGILRVHGFEGGGTWMAFPTQEAAKARERQMNEGPGLLGATILGAAAVNPFDGVLVNMWKGFADPDDVFNAKPVAELLDVAKYLKERREEALRVGEDPAVTEYRSLLPAVLNKEKKPWHTQFEFLSNTVKEGSGWRVRYKTHCLADSGPEKEYVCYEFDSVLSLDDIRKAVPGMKKRLGR